LIFYLLAKSAVRQKLDIKDGVTLTWT